LTVVMVVQVAVQDQKERKAMAQLIKALMAGQPEVAELTILRHFALEAVVELVKLGTPMALVMVAMV